MKVLLIILDYGERKEFTERTMVRCSQTANYPHESIVIDRLGVSAAINEGIDYAIALDFDAVVTMANDILMPTDWLKNMVSYAEIIDKTGLVGIHTVEGMPPMSDDGVHDVLCPFGNVLITREVINTIGFYNLDLDPYSVNDADYAIRANMAGFRNYYIPGDAQHLGTDVGQQTPYRLMKDEGLRNSKGDKWIKYYKETGDLYLDYEQ